MNNDKIKGIKQYLAIISPKIGRNTGIGDKQSEYLKKLYTRDYHQSFFANLIGK